MAGYEEAPIASENSVYDPQGTEGISYDAVKGCCRTEDGGHGTYTTRAELDQVGCQDACTADQYCTAYEFGMDCELHTTAISYEDDEEPDVTCYVKRSQAETALFMREPDPIGPELPDLGTWERWTSVHCSGLQSHELIEFDAEASEIETLAECIELCAQEPRCGGVQTQDPFHGCWLRTKADLKECYNQPPWVMYTPKRVDSTGPPWLLIGILLCIGAIALAVCCLWKNKLLCFKEEEEDAKLTDAEAKSFKAMDLDGDGVITQAEFHQYRQERSCQSCFGGGDSKDDK